MSYYVKRTNPETGRTGWTGPIRSERQAQRETEAWQSAGWDATRLLSTSSVRNQVRDWQKARKS